MIFVLPTYNSTKFHFRCQWAFWVSLDICFLWFKHHSFEVKHLQSCPFPHIVCGLPVGRCAWNPLGCLSWILLCFCSSITWLLQYGSWCSYLQCYFPETVQWTIFFLLLNFSWKLFPYLVPNLSVSDIRWGCFSLHKFQGSLRGVVVKTQLTRMWTG